MKRAQQRVDNLGGRQHPMNINIREQSSASTKHCSHKYEQFILTWLAVTILANRTMYRRSCYLGYSSTHASQSIGMLCTVMVAPTTREDGVSSTMQQFAASVRWCWQTSSMSPIRSLQYAVKAEGG
eukprot:3258106-Amphidinium_carterae.1